MHSDAQFKNANAFAKFRNIFTTREIVLHSGDEPKHISVRGRTQAIAVAVAAVTIGFSGYGVAQAAVGAATASGIAQVSGTSDARVAQMRAQVQKMRADVAAVKVAAKEHAALVEQRQQFITAVLSGDDAPASLGKVAQARKLPGNPAAEAAIAPLRQVERRQVSFAVQARAAVEQRVAMTEGHLRKLGLKPERFTKGLAMGGPYEPATSADAVAAASADPDATFRSLFMSWKKLDVLEQTAISIPSLRPVSNLSFTSNFGIRSDPFRGTAAMHAGVDIPGPIGTPVYATADGIIERAGRAGGYGNLVEINHGKGIETRYGHLSKILVGDNMRVRRGQLIGLMGSTGRSTGSHLHYEVRIDGHAVNPVPFLQPADYMVAAEGQAKPQKIAVGGPGE